MIHERTASFLWTTPSDGVPRIARRLNRFLLRTTSASDTWLPVWPGTGRSSATWQSIIVRDLCILLAWWLIVVITRGCAHVTVHLFWFGTGSAIWLAVARICDVRQETGQTLANYFFQRLDAFVDFGVNLKWKDENTWLWNTFRY